MIGLAIGTTTVQKVRHGEAPSVCAASVISGSSRVSCGYSVRTQYGNAM